MKHAINVNFRLPFDNKGGWLDQYKNSKNPIFVMGMFILLFPNWILMNFVWLFLGEHKISEYSSNWISSSAQISDEPSLATEENGWNTKHMVLSLAVILAPVLWYLLRYSAWKIHTWQLMNSSSLGQSSYSQKEEKRDYSPSIELPSGFVQVLLIITTNQFKYVKWYLGTGWKDLVQPVSDIG